MKVEKQDFLFWADILREPTCVNYMKQSPCAVTNRNIVDKGILGLIPYRNYCLPFFFFFVQMQFRVAHKRILKG